jgi:hypothetical protein
LLLIIRPSAPLSRRPLKYFALHWHAVESFPGAPSESWRGWVQHGVWARLRCCLTFRTEHRGRQQGRGCRPLAKYLLPVSLPAGIVCRSTASGISWWSPILPCCERAEAAPRATGAKSQPGAPSPDERRPLTSAPWEGAPTRAACRRKPERFLNRDLERARLVSGALPSFAFGSVCPRQHIGGDTDRVGGAQLGRPDEPNASP